MIPNALVRLFQEERAQRVDDSKDRLAAATARATQAATEAKKLWGFVKDGFVAQRQAENADIAAKAATKDQIEAQKSLDEAQSRLKDARKDIEAAMRNAQMLPAYDLAQLTLPARTFQIVPNTYRLSVFGSSPPEITVQNGVVLRKLDPQSGEAGAWLVRCVDPSTLRLGVDHKPAKLWIRSLPEPETKPRA